MALKSRAGFTLVELMVALVAGAMVVAAVSGMYGSSARYAAQQMQVADAQMNLRAGMDQLRRDIARAGFLAVPDSRLLRRCDGSLNTADDSVIYRNTALSPANRFIGLNITKDGSLTTGATKADVSTLLNTAVNRVRADDVTMYGNYVTADQYITEKQLNSTTQFYPSVTSEAFRRSFFKPAASNGSATFDQTLFESTFSSGRMVRIETNGKFFFRNISSSDGSNAARPVITVTDAMPPSPCYDVNDWLIVSPVNGVHYGLEADSAADLTRLKSMSAGTVPGQRRTMLVRREVDANGALVANTGRVVLDYAVEFGLDAIYNAAADIAANRPTYAYALADDVTTSTTTVATPSRLRSLLVTIATRSLDYDPSVPFLTRRQFGVANTLNSPLLTFRVTDPTAAFAGITTMVSRVRTMRSEIFLENF